MQTPGLARQPGCVYFGSKNTMTGQVGIIKIREMV
jgi:hypothetical protein